MPGKETQCPHSVMRGIDVNLSLSPQVTFQKMPGATIQGNLEAVSYMWTHIFHSSPFRLGLKQPCSLMISSDP